MRKILFSRDIKINGPDKKWKIEFLASGVWETIVEGKNDKELLEVQLHDIPIKFVGFSDEDHPRMVKDESGKHYWATSYSFLAVSLCEYEL